MKFTILGKLINSKLSEETIDIVNKLLKLENKNLQIELLFVDENTYIDMIMLPKEITIKVYNNIIGDNEKEKYVKLVDHYSNNHSIGNLILALGNLDEELVPLLGERLKLASFIDCVGLEYSESKNELSLLKPEYSGNVISHYTLKDCSVLSFRYQKLKLLNFGNVIPVKVEYVNYKIHVKDKYISKEYLESQNTNLEDADFVIVCGFGVGNKENVTEIINYGKKIGATVCGTKKIIDSGWLPMNLMIGQTGHIISPSLCITIGVSGAAPLLNGIIGSKKIIAINNDKNARIFSYADYGIIGDYKKIIAKGLNINESN
ncbi:Electron transfer flavoprotein subunit alpha [Candidatus Izimaplasma bacterium HR1]|jgi:electron transfer flavoprotein alpha subunit|uniref:electron transfer flavoprotein subunit alpha/FixB family protein n=1 Tax=Candidatus Izimoplasma sp. HR1 TaxID=1541959 RepID=UPI0004F6D6B8|nr:Electron transfer flavoprotein subunit alpha [Candidatus Izimaplasma bacterium HR1]